MICDTEDVKESISQGGEINLKDHCESTARIFMYIGLVLFILLLAPLQYFWFTIFKEYYEEIKDREAPAQQYQ